MKASKIYRYINMNDDITFRFKPRGQFEIIDNNSESDLSINDLSDAARTYFRTKRLEYLIG